MAHLVGQGELAVQGAGVVQQHIGVDGGTGRISTAALAHVLVHVNPTVVKALLQNLPVVLTQRGQGIVYRLLGFGKGNLLVCLLHQRRINIVKMQLLQPQKFLPQGYITMHFIQVFMHRINQVPVYGGRHLGIEQGCLKGVGEVPCLGKELQLLVLAVQQAGSGVLEPGIGVVQALEGILPQHPVRALLAGDIGALADGMGLSLAVQRIREGQVRIGKHTEGVAGGLGNLTGGSQELLLTGAEHMVLLPAQVGQVPAVPLQARAYGIELCQSFVGNGQDLRGFKADGSAQGHHSAHKFTAHGLVFCLTGILIGLAHTVIAKKVCLAVHPLHIDQVVQELFG